MLEDALRFIPLAFAALFPIINPFGSALIFTNIVGPAPVAVYRRLAIRIAIGMLIFVAVVELVGAMLLKVFGISLPVLQVAGGLTIAAMGWRMVNAQDAPVADPAAQAPDVDKTMELAFYPLTFPLTVGPGAIVVVLTLSAHAAGLGWERSLMARCGIFVASILLAILVYLCYAYAPRLERKIPGHMINGIQRLVSFILLCIGVQIAWGGLHTLLGTLVH